MGTQAQPSTVEVDGYTIESSSETADQMISALSPKSKDSSIPREVKPKGEEEDDKSPLSKAASEMGKEGAKAAAKARAASAKDAAKEAKGKGADPETVTHEDEADAEEAKEAKSTKGNPRHDPEARIGVLAREKKEAQEKAETAAARADKAERQLAEERKTRTPAAPAEERRAPVQAATKAPELAEFKTYEDYVDARSEWKAREVIRGEREAAAKESEQRQAHEGIKAALGDFFGRLEKAATEDNTFKDRTRSVQEKLVPTFTLPAGQRPGPLNVVADEVINSDHSAAMLAHFADNPDEFQRIATLRTPREIARAMAKLEARIEDGAEAVTADTSSEPEVSKAKPPVRSVTGAPRIANAEPNEDSSYDEHKGFYNARDAQKRRASVGR